MKCPKNHELPYKVGGVSCGPDFCASKNKVATIPAGAITTTQQDAVKESSRDESRHALAVERYKRRRDHFKTPTLATAEEAKSYVDKRLAELLPDAVDRVAGDLLLGDEEASRKAAYEVLDRQGFGRKEGLSQPGAPIVIVTGGGAAYTPPWAQRVVEALSDKGDK